MPKRQKLIQLYFREGILVDSIEPIEHPAVCPWAQPSPNPVCAQGKESELVQDLLLELVLYTRSSVDFFETYPGKYVPTPLRIRLENTEQTQLFLAREILALTKMNWNNTQFDRAQPITLQASRNCSNVLRYCSEGRQIEPRYSYYM